MDGFLELQSAEHLLVKLRHDFALLEERPMDTYRAFNFFVTAEHMADWKFPGRSNDTPRKQIRKHNILLQICSHLANGLKHFRAEAKHHQSVTGAVKSSGVYGNAYPDTYLDVHPRGIIIRLEGDAEDTYGDSMYAVDLARKTLQFWETICSAK